ncbi:hypothetical protein FAK_22170 [Desulfoferula mesophila]|uniref:Cysteine-rich domain-containing protein n=1 Tax=Desulfoferula mesophila TaxID=3058419 RepID=A0AAU9EDB0_9BACT|nr:hypothetical protein FAK_22170 [Desulfoferula mesophilus]
MLDFLMRGEDSPILRERLKSCMKCYRCVSKMCPEGLNPLRTLEICAKEMFEAGLVEYPPWDAKDPELVHRVLASIQITTEEYRRIMTPSPQARAETVFFAGCNVYYQPEKLLNAMDVMAQLDGGYAFVPGLDYCCGNCYLIRGRSVKAGEAFEELLAKLLAYQPKTLVLWCPTCFCLFETTFGEFTSYPFEIKSMAQYVSERLDRLQINQPLSCKVTVHDACKVALTGLDLVGSREVLRHLGVELVEMPRSAQKAACCGCSAIRHYPLVGYQMLEARIAEAAETGATIMATVCHYCNQMLASRQEGAPFTVENYINLLASGMGVEREDKFRKYKAWADAERILEDAAPFVSQSPFSHELIKSTVRTVFEG